MGVLHLVNMVDPTSGYTWYEILGSVLYVEWGIVHIAAMVMLCLPAMRNNMTAMYTALYDKYMGEGANAVPYNELAGKWPKYTGRVLMQHSFNLGIAGFYACSAPAFIASQTWNRFTWVFALLPYFADCAYWITLDVPELVGIVGQLQTYIVSTGLFCFAFSVNERWKDMGTATPGDFEKYIMYILPCLLFGIGLLQKLLGFAGITFNCFICDEGVELTEDGVAQVPTTKEQGGVASAGEHQA